jgi:predicted metal-dependent phosphotriesterase family hydrolase
MFDSFLPRLAKLGVPEEVSMRFLVDNPRRIFELTPA